MTPLPSNPSLPQTRTLKLLAPFGGVYRRNLLPAAEGNLWYLHRASKQDGTIQCLPGCTSTHKTMTKLGHAASERTRGVIQDPEGQQIYAVTEHRLSGYDFSVIDSSWALGNGTAPGGAKSITMAAGGMLDVGLCQGCKIYVNSTYWYTVDDVPDNNHITTVENTAAFAGVPVQAYLTDFTETTEAWYGPRYCWFTAGGYDRLIVCGVYGLYCMPFPQYGPTGHLVEMRCFQRTYRGLDVINFAGRPVVIGAVEAASEYDDTPTPKAFAEGSDRLRWPTKSDFTDWSSYGSGFLDLSSDGAGLRCGTTWGVDAYVFSGGKSIYQLIETGQSASNPIDAIPHRAMLPEPIISNCVLGLRGIYFWTLAGPALFDGNQVVDLSQNLEIDLGSRGTSLQFAGVHVWRDAYTRTIRFHNWNLQTPVLQYIFWEDSGQWTTLDEDDMYAAGIGQWSSSTVAVLSTPISSGTTVSAIQNEESGMLDIVGGTLDFRATWRGICMEEGPGVNKVIHHIRVLFQQIEDSNILLSMVQDTQIDAVADAKAETIDPTPSESLQWAVFTPQELDEHAVWRLDIRAGARTKIHQVLIEYSVAGETEGSL